MGFISNNIMSFKNRPDAESGGDDDRSARRRSSPELEKLLRHTPASLRGAMNAAAFAILGLSAADCTIDHDVTNISAEVGRDVQNNVAAGSFLSMTHGNHSPRFEAVKATFERIYSSKPGKIFFIAQDGSIEKEVRVPKEILQLQGSKDQADREKFKEKYAAFVKEQRESVALDADFMSSGSKFAQAHAGSEIEINPGVSRMKRAMELFEDELKRKTPDEARQDKDTLWDILDADGRKVLLEMAAGMFGVESGFNPSVAKGISQLMPETAQQLGMQSEDVLDMEKAVPKTAEYFKKMYATLSRPGGPVDLIQAYGLPDSRFLVYCLFNAYHSGVGNVRRICQNFLMQYPTAASLPPDLRQHLNSGEIFTFMMRRGDSGRGTFGTDSRNYVAQVAAMGEYLMQEEARHAQERVVKNPKTIRKVAKR